MSNNPFHRFELASPECAARGKKARGSFARPKWHGDLVGCSQRFGSNCFLVRGSDVMLTVPGLLLERIIEIRSGDTWRNVLDKLQTIKVVEYELVRRSRTLLMQDEEGVASVLKIHHAYPHHRANANEASPKSRPTVRTWGRVYLP